MISNDELRMTDVFGSGYESGSGSESGKRNEAGAGAGARA